MIARTERLLLREADENDDAFLYELMNSPGWLRFIGDRGIRNNNDARRYIRDSLIESYTNLGFGLYAVELIEGSLPIGICGFLKRDYLEAPDLGFATLPRFEGRGLTYEAASSALDYAEETLKMTTILAITKEENTASRRLLEKCAFKPTGKVNPTPAQELLLYRRLPPSLT